MTKPYVPIVFVFCVSLSAQDFRFGLKTGVPLSSPLDDSSGLLHNGGMYHAASKRPIFGATFEYDLPFSLTASIDALYNRVTIDAASQHFSASSTSTYYAAKTVGNRVEFPILLKWYTRPGLLRPFIGAGFSLESVFGARTDGVLCQSNFIPFPSSACLPAGNLTEKDSLPVGLVLDSGIDFQLSFLRFSPEIRLTKWNNPHFDIPANKTQVHLLLAFKCCSK